MINMKPLRDRFNKSKKGNAKPAFENTKVNDIHYSRYIASWYNVCMRKGEIPYYDEEFKDWLKSMGIPERDIIDIHEMANCGKMELEHSAMAFMQGS